MKSIKIYSISNKFPCLTNLHTVIIFCLSYFVCMMKALLSNRKQTRWKPVVSA